MTFNELHPTIQSWIDSDEFIDSLVSVVKEFNLPSSAPLSDSIIDLVLKNIRPEEFKTKLLSSLLPEKQNDGLVTRLVNLSLLPIKNPLAESGIDISVIAPLDETNAIPYSPNTKQSEEQNEAVEVLPTEKQEDAIEAVSVPIVEVSPENTPISPIESVLMPSEQLSSALNKSAPLVPNFNANTKSSLPSPSTKEPSSAPFIIHAEKTIPQVSINSHKENLIRPMFYSGKQEAKGRAPIANIEFGEMEGSKKINPSNIVDLNNLSS